jgi:hypothetical protein
MGALMTLYAKENVSSKHEEEEKPYDINIDIGAIIKVNKLICIDYIKLNVVNDTKYIFIDRFVMTPDFRISRSI